ncbi:MULTISPECIES: DUF805 domain-containing protein [Staphylococcus]|uniref:Uncharacterized membrane protein YhaH, DUF805 family n=2 Tax=Staphylococcus TaxID=1279 RepID=A0ABY1H3K7_9STAP|nr:MULTISPECIES: DUF805 domain-containing protein [Staphylococcus]ATH61957.1 hypothetical protein BJG87_02555 [Staphylococcus pasteuri]KKI56270.1 hypothetical protein UF70_1832 [Staphylococcus pasteuri]MBM6508158.1 DUF805 domain-containing protein [Staphylococcus pasteuri]MCD9067090.1 DUF805 domain-containing protein [Staphylococcus pasteuri]MCE3022342.1 DUF805 domain-containing protein [Staphylococcus pasteuri]
MREKVGFKASFKLYWSNYFNFKGRSRRSEYWFMQLWHLIFMCPGIILLIIGAIGLTIGISSGQSTTALSIGVFSLVISVLYLAIYSLVTIIPNLAILARRFHDTSRTMWIPMIGFGIAVFLNIFNWVVNATGHSENGWLLLIYWLITIISWIFGIYNIVICCLNSQRETNIYGPSPKYEGSEMISDNNYNPVDKANKKHNYDNNEI